MNIVQDILDGKEKVAVVGLGYVGLPLAVSFAEKVSVIGFDIDNDKIVKYKRGLDPTSEVGNAAISVTSVDFTSDEKRVGEAKFIIIAVPTPINADKTPDLTPIIEASKIVGRNLQKNSVVVYESTVYPGVTENISIPILEKESGLKCGADFKTGYSPERVNPGDHVHKIKNIVKIVSGSDNEACSIIADIYGIVVEAGIHRVSSIRVAEAAKVVENSQRDINIAFMNELAMVFDRMEIDTGEVIAAMNTKWNALGFYPGLVGGHCIGVDPYYFIYEAERLGYHSQIILSGRKINDGMAKFIFENIIKNLILANKVVKESRIGIMGLTFKENCPDIRNSKVEDIVNYLKSYGINPILVDPVADKENIKKIYGDYPVDCHELCNVDCLVFAVAHNEFRELSGEHLKNMFKTISSEEKILIDVKGIFDKAEMLNQGYRYWSL
jgi:UDP-N-acetyl-D-galactosamine dehydrogenase